MRPAYPESITSVEPELEFKVAESVEKKPEPEGEKTETKIKYNH